MGPSWMAQPGTSFWHWSAATWSIGPVVNEFSKANGPGTINERPSANQELFTNQSGKSSEFADKKRKNYRFYGRIWPLVHECWRKPVWDFSSTQRTGSGRSVVNPRTITTESSWLASWWSSSFEKWWSPKSPTDPNRSEGSPVITESTISGGGPGGPSTLGGEPEDGLVRPGPALWPKLSN